MLVQREQIARAAGFFNGEGCTSVSIRTTERHIRVQIAQCSEIEWEIPEDLIQFQQTVNVGRVLGPYPKRQTHHKYEYRFIAHSFQEVQQIICILWEHLSEVKRLQAMRALETYRQSTRRSYVRRLSR